MESTKCLCKGIRTCTICSIYKPKIIEKKKNSQKQLNLNQYLSITEEYMITEEHFSSAENNSKKLNAKITSYSIDLSNLNTNLNSKSVFIKETNEEGIKNRGHLMPLLTNLLTDIEDEIIKESNNYPYYKPLINFIRSEKTNKLNDEKQLDFNQQRLVFNGFFVIKNLFDDAEQEKLIRAINNHDWNESQSGRKKQDYGPKINYKKKKLRIDELNLEININKIKNQFTSAYKNIINEKAKETYGINNDYDNKISKNFNFNFSDDKKLKYRNFEFPYFTGSKCSFYNIIQEKLNKINLLSDFKVAEIGNLHYDHSRGAHIEPHIDDSWIWGKRIVGINLLSDTKMTFSREFDSIDLNNENHENQKEEVLFEIEFPVAKGDVYIMTDYSRYVWKHAVKQEHITQDRMVVTLREFEENFLNDYFIQSI